MSIPLSQPSSACASVPQNRLQQRDDEHLIYEASKPVPDGNGPQILSPLQMIDRLADLVPPPR